MQKIQLPDMKRGATFEYIINITKNGEPYDIQLSDIRSEVRTSTGKLLAECSKELISVGSVRFYVDNTDNWPIGVVESDYDVMISGKKIPSATYVRNVEKDITRPLVEA